MTPRDLSLPPAPEPLPGPVVDNHCHLDVRYGESALDADDALERAADVGVPRIVQIGCHVATAQWSVDLAERHPQVIAGVAVHPNDAARSDDLESDLRRVEELVASSERVRAVGETGLDTFRTGPEGMPAQIASFRRHIEMAKRLDKTLVIHDRDAHEQVLEVLAEEGAPERWVMHCFSGDALFARACLDRGAYLSFAGTVTFKPNDDLRAALRLAPRDRVLVETDAPFLTPTPFRGRPNASYLVPVTMRAMAEVRGDDLADLCAAVDANTDAAFGGTWGRSRPQ